MKLITENYLSHNNSPTHFKNKYIAVNSSIMQYWISNNVLRTGFCEFILTSPFVLCNFKLVIMKWKFKQWWSTLPPISTKQTITSKQWWSTKQTITSKQWWSTIPPLSTKWIVEHKNNTMTYDVWNPGPGLTQVQNCELNWLMVSREALLRIRSQSPIQI